MQDYRMETFIAVCKSMNYTHAAEELHLAQPTVSLHIHMLEQHYGTKLFEFQGKKMRLTDAGKLVYDAAVTQQNDDKRLLKKIELGRRAPIRLGATLSVAECMLSQPLTEFLKRHTRDFIQINIDNTKVLLSEIDKGTLDAAFVEGVFPSHAYDAVTYRKDAFAAVCSSQYPGRREWTRVEELLNIPLLIRENGSGTRGILERFLAEYRYTLQDFKRVIEIGSIHLIKELVKSGCGITFIYEAAVREELAVGEFVKIPLEGCDFCHDISFIWRKDSLYAEEYKEILRGFQETEHVPAVQSFLTRKPSQR